MDSPRWPLRLRLKPNAPPTGYVDGAWWPRSRVLTDELAALIDMLTTRVGPVIRIAFVPGEWAPMAVETDRAIRLVALRPQEKNIMRVSGSDGRQLTLLVVPPGVPERAGYGAMMLAARPATTQRPADILAAAGLPVVAQQNNRMMRPRLRTRHAYE
jgi:hypothetical protein